MNGCLHITIHENASALPPRAAAHLPGRAGTDPADDDVMPRLKDPADDDVMPRLKDPDGADHAHPSGVAGGYGAAVATVGSCCCAAPAGQGMAAPAGAAVPHPYIRPRDYSGFIIVRLAEGIEHSAARSLWDLARELELPGLQAVLELPIAAGAGGQTSGQPEASKLVEHFLGGGKPGGNQVSPPFPPPEPPPTGTLVSAPLVELRRDGLLLPREACLAAIRALEKKAAVTAFPPRHSLTAYWRLDLREHPGLVEEVMKRLNRLAEVDLAYRELAAGDPQTAETIDGMDFAEDQGYLADAPAGIGASWACLSATGSYTASSPKLILCDLEQGWSLGHDDFKDVSGTRLVADPFCGANRFPNEGSSGHHGTAVLGQLVAAGTSSFGVKGAAAGLSQLTVASHYRAKASGLPFAGTNGHLADAVVHALSPSGPLKAGDILLIEAQRGLLPTEIDEADFDALRLAAGQGVIVVEAAGNGGFDLDLYSDPDIRRSLRRGAPGFRDSGAILVGASRASLPHDRAPFSNYGSRIDCFGWGEAVTTCGYGDLAGTGDTDYYTNSFSGTSSASPIIAGAAVLLQSLHVTQTGERLEPREMRALLADPETGTRQGPNVPGHIGVMPDLKAIVVESLRIVPHVSLRRSLGDDGSRPAPDDEISSSPDILVWSEGLQKTRARYAEGSGRENLPAPGDPVKPGEPNKVYVRLRNRGLGLGGAQVRLFASPAATLITPERWIPIATLNVSPIIPQGDTLFVPGPAVWQQPPSTPNNAWSFLAVLSQPGKSSSGSPYYEWASGLPPGHPYFDWEAYRAFLRRPGVAWRNTYRFTAASPSLSFFIAGTPDRARRFDFEVIQRLPAGAEVTLQVPPALAAKLRQRQPWLGSGPLALPKRPRTAIRGVELAAGACIDAAFAVSADTDQPLTAGHSLALRQLWRGEEVGRITWYFGPEP